MQLFIVLYLAIISSEGFKCLLHLFPAGASKKIQSMTFSTEHRADLLTEALVSLN